MKKLFVFILVLLHISIIYAHSIHESKHQLHTWSLKNNTKVNASFFMSKNNLIYLEDENDRVIQLSKNDISSSDLSYVNKKIETINQLNNTIIVHQESTNVYYKIILISVILLLLISSVYIYKKKYFVSYLLPLIFIFILGAFYSFEVISTNANLSITDPLVVDNAFIPFKPQVNTSWDGTYFYVESKGIPTTHHMMAGISNHGWQQQVPIPQCYIKPNAWNIPLNPSMAVTPIPVNAAHFSRGAIAIAVNGVPIFNPYTNTGVDAFLDGQLDSFGGHCGRGDDYHYHIAPLHLYSHTTNTLPIAYAFDGFAVYGSKEPDGSPMSTLDLNHGHYGTDGVYHYHGTNNAPYMIANMVGSVTEDSTHQLIPQAQAHPVRPGLTPLAGALITSCVENSTHNGYILTYTLGGQTYQVDYSWSGPIYTFHFINPSGTIDSVFNGFNQCNLPQAIEDITTDAKSILLYPNPAKNEVNLFLANSLNKSNITSITIYSPSGSVVFNSFRFQSKIDITNLVKGTYYLRLKTDNQTLTKRFLIE